MNELLIFNLRFIYKNEKLFFFLLACLLRINAFIATNPSAHTTNLLIKKKKETTNYTYL